MKLSSRNVFIDTVSFKRMGLNFDHPALRSFTELCEEGKLHYFTTTVVKREVEARIRESIEEALGSLKSFRRKASMLHGIQDKHLQGLFSDVNEEEIYIKAVTVFNEFIEKANCVVIDASNINSEEMLNLYFEKKAPFGDGKKKSEFPDAISLLSLLSRLESDSAYVISEDSDLKAFCEQNNQLSCIDTLDKFLDLYFQDESTISELIKKYLEDNEKEIKRKLKDAIENAGAYNEAPWDESEVGYFEVKEIYDLEPSIISVNENKCFLTIDADVRFEYEVTGPDFFGGFYDKEIGRMITFGNVTHSGDDTRTFTIQLAYSYEVEDGKLVEVDEIAFSIEGISDGVAVFEDEVSIDYM